MGVTRREAINDGLARLEGIGFTMAPGFSEHGPMVAEAISSLGCDERVGGWVDAYKAKREHLPVPPRQGAIAGDSEDAWGGALGVPARISDWLDFFRRALAAQPWQDVLRLWLPRLMDGAAAALTHGLIRTAHAVRALPRNEVPTALERDELARGLALWAATYQKSAGNPDRIGTSSLDDALRALPRGPGAAIVPAIESLAATPDIGAAISRHTATFARLLLTHAELAPIPTIQLVHTVTAPHSLRDLLPYLPADESGAAYRRLWQVSAAMVARLARVPADGRSEINPAIEPSALGREELAARAVAHGDEHVIKLTEACLGEEKLSPDPVYRALASAVQQRLPAWG